MHKQIKWKTGPIPKHLKDGRWIWGWWNGKPSGRFYAKVRFNKTGKNLKEYGWIIGSGCYVSTDPKKWLEIPE